MKTLAKVLSVGLMAILLVQGAYAQVESVGKLDIKAIKKMQFTEQGKDLIADTVLVFVNNGDKETRLRTATFNVSVKSGDQVTPMGVGTIAELTFPAGTADAPGELVKEMPIKVGPKNDETIQRLLALFNVFGDPSIKFSLLLAGDCEVGVPVGDKGWAYQKVSLEMEFEPTFQPEFFSR